MHSPAKNQKKIRKNTFSQTTVTQTEVGEFEGGYFVMPDAASSKENDCPHKMRVNKHTEQRSPARRKFQTNEAIPSPHKERPPKSEDFKKPFADISKDIKKEGFRNEQISPSSPTKMAPASPKQHMDYSDHKYLSKDSLSTSPSSTGRWAGPAFGNAPHPSSLPLPEFPPMNPASSIASPSHFLIQDSYLSTSPPGHDGTYPGLVYQPHPHPQALPFSQLPSSPPPSSHLSSIPVVPFPYVGVHQFPVMPPAHVPSLAQLSTDLRRMLNISGSQASFGDPIMVSANSS